MPIHLTVCRLCIASRPDFQRAVRQLIAENPSEIDLVELDCMAACDDVPAVMVETDYYAQIIPQDLARIVRERIQLNPSRVG